MMLGAALTCLLAYFVLPNVPVVKAEDIQPQPALVAYFKNAILYFLPLYAVFILLIFCFVYGPNPFPLTIGFPVGFGILWILIFAYSEIARNYLSDNLKTEDNGKKYKYHGLYTLLLIFRAIFCFLPTALAILYYFFHSIEPVSP